MKFLRTATLILASLAIATAPIPARAGTPEDFESLRASTARPFVDILRVASNVADAETVTINGVVFEADTASTATITAGRVRININAAQTPTAFCDAFVTAFGTQNMRGLTLTKISANELLLTAPTAVSVAETLAGSNNAWAASTAYGGVVKPTVPRTVQMVKRTANATEVALGAVRVVFPFTPVHARVTVTTSAGVAVAWDGAATITGSRVDVDNSGTTDWAATDIVTVTATN